MNRMENNIISFSDLLQLLNLFLNIKQTSPDEIMEKLENQDDMFLKTIIDKLNIIDEKINKIT